MTAEAQLQRWKLTAIAAIALLIGLLVGSLVPPAQAQDTSSARVQLSTQNCETVVDVGYFPTTLASLQDLGGFVLTIAQPAGGDDYFLAGYYCE